MIHTNPNADPQGRYGVEDAANLLGIHRCTLWRWVRKGWIKPMVRKINNRIVFRGCDIISAWEAYI